MLLVSNFLRLVMNFLSFCFFLTVSSLLYSVSPRTFFVFLPLGNHFLSNVILLMSPRFFCISFCLLLVYSRLNQFLKLTSISKFSAFTTEENKDFHSVFFVLWFCKFSMFVDLRGCIKDPL